MNKFIYKSGLKLKNELSSLRFYLINLVYLIIYFAIVLAFYLVNKQHWDYAKMIDAFSVPAFVTFLISLFALIIKLGYFEKTFSKFKIALNNFSDSREQKELKKMSNEHKRKYLEKKEEIRKKQELQKALHPKTKFPFVFASTIYFIISIVFIIVIYA
ncbi:DUF3899 domain-containing protein [Mycoplasmopsis verecunda]|uniref:Uncharacterized protein n=1 Tax=Mycoplasmopsis verecunda TaxID=171291 RepID=A0A1T4L7E8_9BACT|nr:DUF3899 domain-containing protein [Mycoplasmopsis verecunda]WPB54774.1 DUF3899 domain-containing protein [Mycoplasmopsis verecunda]SJZ50470.1 protein of unknown function [Mycoplasmopsis verecunda]